MEVSSFEVPFTVESGIDRLRGAEASEIQLRKNVAAHGFVRVNAL